MAADGLVRPPENHMENVEILQLIFRYCVTTFDSVKTLRLVCKAWKEASGPHWSSFTVPLQVLPPDPPADNDDTLHENLKQGVGITLSQFLEQKGINPQTKLVYRNLHLDGWTINAVINFPPRPENNEDAQVADYVNERFWTLHGRNIKMLTLRNCTVPSYCINFFSGSSFLTALPNLEQLSLIDCKMKRIMRRHRSRTDRLLSGYRKPSPIVRQQQETEEKMVTTTSAATQETFGFEFKRLHVQQLTNSLTVSLRLPEAPIMWSKLIESLPSVKKLAATFQDGGDNQEFARTLKIIPFKGATNSKSVDVIGIYASSNEMASEEMMALQWKRLQLRKLTLDLEFCSGEICTLDMLDHYANTLKDLCLFRSPFSQPISRFPCTFDMVNLTKLQLWGNVVANFNFLVVTPNLRVVKWNTSCYDEKSRGARLHKKMGTGQAPAQFSVDNLVQNSDQLGDSFKMECMETLKIHSVPSGVDCIKMLGKWMPRIKRLKIVVVGNDEFVEIGKQWPQLEHLELAHGSSVTADGFLESQLTHRSLIMLESFTWKPCPCIKTTFGDKERYAESELRKNAGRNVVVPWRRGSMLATLQQSVCVEALFEKALREGGNSVSEFLNSLQNNSNDLTMEMEFNSRDMSRVTYF